MHTEAGRHFQIRVWHIYFERENRVSIHSSEPKTLLAILCGPDECKLTYDLCGKVLSFGFTTASDRIDS